MSNPYIYNASTRPKYPNWSLYYFTPHSSTRFFPDVNPYHSNPTYLPGTYYIGSSGIAAIPVSNPQNSVPFPSPSSNGGYTPAWDNHTRHRHSWCTPAPAEPFFPLQNYPVTPIYNRRRSIGNYAYPLPQNIRHFRLPHEKLYPQHFAQAFYINPWINAEALRGDFFFDLAPTTFRPLHLFGGGCSVLLAPDQLDEPATYPTLTRLRIICDPIPIWRVDLETAGPAVAAGYGQRSQVGPPPPITLADVLVAIHRSLHQQISHGDWARLGPAQKIEVGQEYTRRCHAVGSVADRELVEGVKRVDFLLGRTSMVGLMRDRQADGWNVMKLIVVEN